jgi:hypothetical protein
MSSTKNFKKEPPLVLQAYFMSLMTALSLFLVGIWHLNESVETALPQLLPIFFGVLILALNNQLRFNNRGVMTAAIIFTAIAGAVLIFFLDHLILKTEFISSVRVYFMLLMCVLSIGTLTYNLLR